MKAIIAPDLCVGTGSCEAICPEVFEVGDDGIAVVKVDVVPDGCEDSCREACDSCPTDAILIE